MFFTRWLQSAIMIIMSGERYLDNPNDIMDIMTIMMDIMDNILLILLGIWISIIKDDLRIAMTWISIGFV